MPMQPVYLVAIKNLPKFLEALRNAQAPAKVTLRFVEDLGFASTNDRLFIPLLRAMKFIDESGKPTARYHTFLDGTLWKQVLADGVRDAYADIFRVNRNAQNLNREQLAGKIRSLSEGKASPSVVNNTTKTFLELAKLADWATTNETAPTANDAADVVTVVEPPLMPAPADYPGMLSDAGAVGAAPTLVYRIEIVLPAVRDQAVYDAIFQSARAHLLR
jgi:hypothetical protein